MMENELDNSMFSRIKTLERIVQLLDDELSLVKEKLKHLERKDERAKYLD